MQANSADTKRPFGEVVRGVVADVMLLVRQELHLAAAESKPKLARVGLGVGLLLGAAILAVCGLGALVATAIVALALVVPLWLAALIVTIVLLGACAVVALRGLATLKKTGSLVPTLTLQTIKEDVLAMRAGVEHAR
jgi:hypothetical protein